MTYCGCSLPGLCFVLLAITPCLSQTVTTDGASSGKLCVARVANSSGKPVNVESVEQELVQQLVNRKIDAVAAPTMTMLASHLALTPANRKAFPALKCDYMLLTEIASAVGDSSSLALKFSIFDKRQAVLPETMIPAPAGDPSQAAMAAAPTLSDRVASVLIRKKR